MTNDSLMTDRLTEQSQATRSTADVSFPGRKLCDKRMTRMGRAINHMSGSLPTAAIIDAPRRFGSYSEFPITLRNKCNAQPTVAQFVGHTSCVEVKIHFATTENRRGKKKELECGPMPNMMVALPNIGGALCSTPQSLADAHY